MRIKSRYLLDSPRTEGRMWDLIVSVPDHCLSFTLIQNKNLKVYYSSCYTKGAGVFDKKYFLKCLILSCFLKREVILNYLTP